MPKFPLKLQEEAKLLGTWSFILKASIAMFAGFALGRHIPLVNKDMISFLFAMVLTLEPVSTTGIKRGIDQFRATLVGGLLSGLIVAIIGINPLGLALSIASILYFTLVQDWRNLSVVALFTGIYMTQYVQMSPSGNPDILLTMAVRILALSAGIVYAVVFNAAISVAYMRHMPTKRLCFIHYRLYKHVQRLTEKLQFGLPIADSAHLSMSNLFNDIDWNLNLLNDLERDPLLKIGRLNKDIVSSAIARAKSMRTFSHYLFDLEIQLRDGDFHTVRPEVLEALLVTLEAKLKSFAAALENCPHGDEILLSDSHSDTNIDDSHILVQRILNDILVCSKLLEK